MSHRAFRRVFAGTLASNVGTWMQNVILGVLALELTGEAWFIGVLTFAQLGPMLVLSPIGGALADRMDRRRIMVTIAATQMALSLVLAWVATADQPNKVALVLLVGGIGIGAAINGPAASATLPALVGLPDLQGALALNSASMNGSRVIGPVLGGVVAAWGGPPAVFAVNSATYLFVIVALMSVTADFSPKGRRSGSPLQQLREGVAAARADRVISRVLATIAVFSMCSLVFIYQMPLLADRSLGLVDEQYTLLFACFGAGAVTGALSMGSFLANSDRARTTRISLLVFSVALAIFGTTTTRAVAFPAVFALGASYFVMVTALITTLQMRVQDEVRGRVMGLWMMGWAGLVPVGALIAGPVIDATSVQAVLLFGAVVALILAVVVDLREIEAEAGAPAPAPTRTVL